MTSKYCPDCRRQLPLTDFGRDKRRADGVSFYCKVCGNRRQQDSNRRRLGPVKTRWGLGPKVVPAGMKWCPQCSEIKPLPEFPKNRSQKCGHGAYCKPCHNQITRDNREKNGGSRNYHLRRRYGITVDHFDEMFAEQGGVCAICGEAKAEQVDHDHVTKRVRGLLCFNCNGALGQFRDRADLMLKAVAYLRGDPLYAQPGVGVALTLVPTDRLEQTAG